MFWSVECETMYFIPGIRLSRSVFSLSMSPSTNWSQKIRGFRRWGGSIGKELGSLLCHNIRSSRGEIWNWHLYTEGKERPKKEADHSSLVDGRFNKQENWHRRLVLGGRKMNRSPYHTPPPARILKVYIEALMGFSHVSVQMVSTTHYSLKSVSLKWLLVWEWWVEYTFQEQGRGGEPLLLLLDQLAVVSSQWPPATVPEWSRSTLRASDIYLSYYLNEK